jgi:septum formation protein
MKSTLYLASASPRRHALLNQIGIKHEVLHVPSPPGEDEPKLETENPLEYVQRTALDKALRAQRWILKRHPDKFKAGDQISILTADTTVALDTLVLGKPKDDVEAAHILRLLSGQTHTVLTALVLSRTTAGTITDTHGSVRAAAMNWERSTSLSITQVSFGELTDEAIDEYISTKEPFGKAGAYGIQGHAAKFIQRIEGSYSGVMGLPLYETSALIQGLNAQ